jgi:hypothetical protein
MGILDKVMGRGTAEGDETRALIDGALARQRERGRAVVERLTAFAKEKAASSKKLDSTERINEASRLLAMSTLVDKARDQVREDRNARRLELIADLHQQERSARQRMGVLQVAFEEAEAKRAEAEQLLRASEAAAALAWSTYHGACARHAKCGRLGVVGREISALADPRIRELLDWLGSLDDPLRLAHHAVAMVTQNTVAGPRLVAAFNTADVDAALQTLRALRKRTEDLVFEEHGVGELKAKLEAIRDAAVEMIQPLVADHESRFTVHMVSD